MFWHMSDDLKNDLNVPGTKVIIDDTTSATGSDNFKLTPVPSSDPNDPLNWTLRRKWLYVICMVMWVMASCAGMGSLYPIYDALSEETGLTLDQINTGAGYLYFFQQVWSLFSQPLAVTIGTRPIFIVTCAGLCIFPFCLSLVSTNSQWVGLIIVNSIFTSPVYVLPELALSDIFFYHERSFPFGVYISAIWGCAFVVPIYSGFLYTRFGLNGPTYFAGGCCAFAAVFLFLFLEETNFERKVPEHGNKVEAETIDKTTVESRYDLEKMTATTTDIVAVDGEDSTSSSPSSGYEASPHMYNHKTTPWPGPRPFQKSPVSPHWWGILWRTWFQNFAFYRLPILLWCSVIMAYTQIYSNITSALSSGILGDEPYNMSPNMVGLTFVSPLLANIPGALAAGWITDWWTIRKARQNGGVSEPEDKLSLSIIPTILSPIGCLMMGLGPYYGAHWIVFVLGEFVITIAGPLANLIAINYAFDAYHGIQPKDQSGPRFEVQKGAPYILSPTLLAMGISFGFSYAITPWAFDAGFKIWGITAAIVSICMTGSGLLMMIWGKRLRKSGAGFYEKIINI